MSLRATVVIPVVGAILIALAGPAGAAGLPAPVFDSAEAVDANAGHIGLRWHMPQAVPPVVIYELQVADNPEFADSAIQYAGGDTATFVSGLADGTYYYRVRGLREGVIGPWSEKVKVTVQHHSMALAWALFTLGLTVFLATLGVIVNGTRTYRV